MTGMPLRSFEVLFHVGTLQASHKQRDSLEGAGLSVSLHPNAWRKIARGRVSGNTWYLSKPHNQFIVANELPKKSRKQIEDWAIAQGLARREKVWRMEYLDDELDNLVRQDFLWADKAAALDEAALYEVALKQVPNVLVATDELREKTQNGVPPILVFDLVLPLYAEDHGFDGVWWDDILDVAAYSAPRGVIVPSRVKEWEATVQKENSHHSILNAVSPRP
jgi:hypothetical protein